MTREPTDDGDAEYRTDGGTDGPLGATIRVGEVIAAERFEEARKPELFTLDVDLGDEVVQSAAQLGYHHSPDEVVGRQVLCATELGTVSIAGYESQVLTLGVPGDDDNPVLVGPVDDVPLGGELY